MLAPGRWVQVCGRVCGVTERVDIQSEQIARKVSTMVVRLVCYDIRHQTQGVRQCSLDEYMEREGPGDREWGKYVTESVSVADTLCHRVTGTANTDSR